MKYGDAVIKNLNELTDINGEIMKETIIELEKERDTLIDENIKFANFLDGIGYSTREIDDIAGGWLISDKSTPTRER